MQGAIDQVYPPMPVLSTQATLIKANKNNLLATWSGLTAKAVENYLPNDALATDKGYMKRYKKGIRLTKQKLRTTWRQKKSISALIHHWRKRR